ncbi:MAG: hypothetical protein EBV06_13950 [Planctomycetia bacterium]|nr:hypothetical protein [Planctomycetia bacterium]
MKPFFVFLKVLVLTGTSILASTYLAEYLESDKHLGCVVGYALILLAELTYLIAELWHRR